MTATPALRTIRWFCILSLLVTSALPPALAAPEHPGQAALVSEVVRDTGKDPQQLNALYFRFR